MAEVAVGLESGTEIILRFSGKALLTARPHLLPGLDELLNVPQAQE